MVTLGIEACTVCKLQLIWSLSNSMFCWCFFGVSEQTVPFLKNLGSMFHMSTCFLLSYLRFTENNHSCHPSEQSHFSKATLHLNSECPWLSDTRKIQFMQWGQYVQLYKINGQRKLLYYIVRKLSHKWIGRVIIKLSLSDHFYYQHQMEDVLTAALTIIILFTRCVHCAIFHPARLLIDPLPSNSIFSVLQPLVLSILIKTRWHLKKARWPFPLIVDPHTCLVSDHTVLWSLLLWWFFICH